MTATKKDSRIAILKPLPTFAAAIRLSDFAPAARASAMTGLMRAE
jgi:hypothetical protein